MAYCHSLQSQNFELLVENSFGVRALGCSLDPVTFDVRDSRQVAEDERGAVTRNRGHAIAGNCEGREKARHRLPPDPHALFGIVADGDVPN